MLEAFGLGSFIIFVYCCRICIGPATSARMIPKLFEMVSSVSQACFALLRSRHTSRSTGFGGGVLSSQWFLDYCPGSSLIVAVVGPYPPVGVDGAARGEHREALRGVLHFVGSAAAAGVLLKGPAILYRPRCLQMNPYKPGRS